MDEAVNLSLSEAEAGGAAAAHWRRFPAVAYGAHVAAGLLVFVVGALSVMGNALVIVVYRKYRSVQTPANLLLVALALSDLAITLFCFPLYIVASFHGRWPFPDAVCALYGFAGGACGLASITTMAVIAAERYSVIVRGAAAARRQLTKQGACVCVACVWLYSAAWALPPLLGWNQYTLEGLGTSCSFDYITRTTASRLFVVAMIAGGFLTPVAVITYCYTYIVCVLWARRRRGWADMGRHGREYKRRRVEINTSTTLLGVIALFCLSWLPYAAVSLIGIFGDQSLITPWVSAIPGLLAKCSTFYNPIVYAVCLPRFKKKIRALALQKCCGIEGDLIVVDRWTSPDASSTSLDESGQRREFRRKHHTGGSLIRQHAIRAPSGMRRSEYSDSNDSSYVTGSKDRCQGNSKVGVIVRYKKSASTDKKLHSRYKRQANNDGGSKKTESRLKSKQRSLVNDTLLKNTHRKRESNGSPSSSMEDTMPMVELKAGGD